MARQFFIFFFYYFYYYLNFDTRTKKNNDFKYENQKENIFITIKVNKIKKFTKKNFL